MSNHKITYPNLFIVLFKNNYNEYRSIILEAGNYSECKDIVIARGMNNCIGIISYEDAVAKSKKLEEIH